MRLILASAACPRLKSKKYGGFIAHPILPVRVFGKFFRGLRLPQTPIYNQDMPIYEYTCKSCKKQFEKLVKTMGSSAGVKCPECGSGETVRNLSVFAVASESKPSSYEPGMCGRCGGPGPCGMN
jgi:putative FmdB family regulatory protein